VTPSPRIQLTESGDTLTLTLPQPRHAWLAVVTAIFLAAGLSAAWGILNTNDSSWGVAFGFCILAVGIWALVRTLIWTLSKAETIEITRGRVRFRRTFPILFAGWIPLPRIDNVRIRGNRRQRDWLGRGLVEIEWKPDDWQRFTAGSMNQVISFGSGLTRPEAEQVAVWFRQFLQQEPADTA
jgi:hypothetical protein